MRILLLNWQDIRNPLGGGAEVHLHEIFKRIVARGHEATLYCCSFPGARREEVLDGIRVIRQGYRNTFNYLVPFRYWSRFRHEHYDVVVDDINKIPFFTPLYVKEPLVGIVHHLFGKSIFAEVSVPAGLYVNAAEQLSFPLYRKIPILVVSESTRREMLARKFPQSNLHLASNAIDHALYRPHGIPPSGAPLIGYLGRLKKYKSIDHLLQALPIVRREIPDIRLVVIGEGDMRRQLEERAIELGIAQSTTFTGLVSPEEKVRWLNRLHIMVNPSAKEGWGLTVSEANACGAPAIASDVPGLRDAVKDGETGLLYEYGNIRQLAEKIVLLLKDEHLRSRLAAAAVKYAGSLTWDASAKTALEVMERAVSAAEGQRR
ncbi:MAG: glycosyltransferase family 4 protein [Chitinispirillaceae bacterium]|nr:glycosyltransferase family 4 protein [Chitinispirillaceae bacterium]